MNLEIEEKASGDCILLALDNVCATYTAENGEIFGNLGKSNAYFVFSTCISDDQVMAEGFSDSWKAGVRAAFHCPNNRLAESWEEIKSYMFALMKECDCKFVLSFQYEKIYAIRNEGEINFINQMTF
ncbi:hypothetical protein NRY95_00960 [Xanthomonas campestris pv. phormiicola]|nr:hypothetical protein [Xanthomonas campestris pv. phormiicola]UYC16585.1 hypothetical protein NRY95_00960 [Xanthomonas campestris pv. phormiicola]